MVATRPALLAAVCAGLLAASLAGPGQKALVLLVVGAGAVALGLRPGASAVVLFGALAGLGIGQAREAALVPAPAPAFVSAGRATVLEAPREERFGWRATVVLGPVRLMARGRGSRPPWSAGSIVEVTGTVRPPDAGEAWLKARRVSGILTVSAARMVGRRGGLAGAIDGIRRRALVALARPLGPREGALLQGMVLGEDASMDPAQREQVRRTGLGHIVAASGSNVALLAGLVLGACGLAGLGRRSRLVVAALAIAGYALLCGRGPSITRAAVMGLASLAAALASRPASRLQALLLAAAVTLAIDPGYWREVGWQLSFAAVIGIAVLSGPLRERLASAGWPRPLAEPMSMTVSATLATAPVAAGTFGQFSPASLPANVLAGPLVAPATWLGMAGAVVAQANAVLAELPVRLAGLPLAAIVFLAGRMSDLPFAQVGAGLIPVACLSLGAAAGLAGLLRPALRRPAFGLAGLAAAGLVACLALGRSAGPGAPPDGGTRVTLLDVGQGDATLFQSRGESLLVDAGPDDGPIVERLREAGVRRLGALLVTHAQADHLGGADRVIDAVGAGEVLDGRDGVVEPEGLQMARAARSHGSRVSVPRAGDLLRVGELSVRVLGPAGPPAPGSDPNLRCVVLRVDGPGLSMLLAGDAESEVLAPLHPGPVRLLKVSHHGSADPGLPALLSELSPELAVIEVGSGNPYGHPDRGTLSALAGSGSRVMRTDRDGSVRVDLVAGALRVQNGP